MDDKEKYRRKLMMMCFSSSFVGALTLYLPGYFTPYLYRKGENLPPYIKDFLLVEARFFAC